MSLEYEIIEIMKRRLGDRTAQYLFPPPVFTTLQGQFAALDLERGILETRFPVLERYLNPYHTLQGGMIAAAVDNTLGPLSVLVAPPNVTRRLEMTYSAPVPLETGSILVKAVYDGREGRRLFFSAEVRGPDGLRMARAKALHYIIDELGG